MFVLQMKSQVKIDKIDYDGVGAPRGQRHIPSKINPSYPPGQQQTQPRYGVDNGSRIQATLVNGRRVLSPLRHP